MKWRILLAAFLASAALAADEKPKPAQSIDELQQQLEKILKDTHTPGASVAIVHRDKPEWVAGLGKADVATGRAATADTLFRIGSVSKGFVSLAILMLVGQHKLSMNDTVAGLAPDLYFENPWEATDPVRVVHLLEHTTGWDDLHFREFAQDAPGWGLKDAFEFDKTSRVSRWRPGTRMAYCNSGPAVAAYIVEKITGMPFEDFVAENLFRPIGMKTATYFQPPAEAATTLYHEDGVKPYKYWNIIMRPSGSINASAKDMAAYLQFYLNRGSAGGKHVVPAADIDRMESPTSTWAAKEGLKTGYGLSNYWSVEDGFVYHGHDGGVDGGVTDMGYMSEYGVGYFYSLNTENGDAVEGFGKAIRGYITRQLEKPPLPEPGFLPPRSSAYSGWYVSDSPRMEALRFLDVIVGLHHVDLKDRKLFFSRLGARNEEWVPTEDGRFRPVPRKGPPSPVAMLQLIPPNDEGRFFEMGTSMMKQIPAWQAYLKIGLTLYFVVSAVSILLYAPVWLLAGFSKKRRRPAERAMRAWPLITVLTLIVFILMIASDKADTEHLGSRNWWSVTLSLTTFAFAASALASGVAVWWGRGAGVRKWVRWYSIAVTVALLIAALYLTYWGVIGLRTWA